MTYQVNHIDREAMRLHKRQHNAWSVSVDHDRLITKNIIDISPTGMSFSIPKMESFDVGQRIHFQLDLSKGENFEGEGEIMWEKTASLEDQDQKIIGIKFIRLPVRAEMALSQEIHSELLKEHNRHSENKFLTDSMYLKSHIDRDAQNWSTAIKLVFTLFISALVLGLVHFYQLNHPESTMAYQMKEAFEHKSQATLNETK